MKIVLIFLIGCAAVARAQDHAFSEQALLDRYCIGCHNQKLRTGGLAIDKLDLTHPGNDAETWEKVVRKIRAGMMPPAGMPRPDRAALDTFAAKLEAGLDTAAAAKPNPGTTGLHRLNRVEYANAIRDLLDLDIDPTTMLPADDSSEGFDNIADALAISPALLERYVAAATKLSRLAVGDPGTTPFTATYRVPSDLAQSEHIEGLPLGTRGGILVRNVFPLDAEYSIKIHAKAANIGLGSPGFLDNEIEVTLNGERVKLAKAAPVIDLRLPIKAGPQELGVAFIRKNPVGADDVWQIYPNNSGVQSVAITGPFKATNAGDTPSRRRIFVCRPASSSDAEEQACAKKILATLAHRAYRGPVIDADLQTLIGFYEAGRHNATFDEGIEQALARVLIDPRFVFRFEREPENVAAGSVYRISDLELASRLSFFLWSSIPDDELLDVATKNQLHEPAVLARETRRMLADPRSEMLATDFAGQWLYLRELKNQHPLSPTFNENLRDAYRHETELLFESILREDRSVVDLLDADYTFVDERLAAHYGIPGVHGSEFRRVPIREDARRGLLGQSSFELVTSVANRTSPVARGKWILENILGSPAPLPPPNVPPLKENEGAQVPTTLRARMEEHRKNPTCAACHKIMDPIGFSLDNFDLIGTWRTAESGDPIDATGQLVDGTKLDGPASLRKALLDRSDVFIQTTTEKLLTYATGRALKYYDMPVVRAIDREAAQDGNRFSAIVQGIVQSDPFQKRMKQAGSLSQGGRP
ncbi:MAG TPA: DUF1592 domain-containing protein [Bryobacteraceae bacterium]|nr:DUF1592 domain-containing protein [Bryobacteraceae bacterium]